MNKIRNRLLITFGISSGVIILVIALNIGYSNKSVLAYDILKLQINPAVKILDDFQAFNKEVFLLSLNKLAAEQDDRMGNRMKVITEVELPYLNRKAIELFATFSIDDPRIKSMNEIMEKSDAVMATTKHLFKILSTSKDYDNIETIQLAKNILYDDIAVESKDLELSIDELQMSFTQEKETYQEELAYLLKSLSLVILFTGFISLLINLIAAYKTVTSVVKPIKILQDGTKKISMGDYRHQVQLQGSDEFSMLGNNFNTMATSLEQSFDAIKRTNKELEQFVYIASHDLQEPLRTVRSFSQLLASNHKEKLGENGRIYIRFIQEASNRMHTLVKDLMDYGRLGTDKQFEQIDCKTIVLGVKADLGKLIEETNSKLIIGNLPEIHGYTTQLRLLFQNLINNGIKFQRPNSKPVIEVFCESFDDYWQFGVKDNGIGVANHNKTKIFSIFKRLHSRSEYKGTGIGLAHCQKIIALHHGKIWIESELNIGSTFYFTISKNQPSQ